MHLGQEAVMLKYQVIATSVIMVGVGHQQAHGTQLLDLNILEEIVTLSRVIQATIDDDGLASLVGQDISALLKPVA